MEQTTETVLRGRISRVLWRDPAGRNIWKALAVETEAGKTMKATGSIMLAEPGMHVELAGRIVHSAKYREDQFEFTSWREIVPESTEGVREYLASGFIKGLGGKLADRIMDAFGKDAITVIREHPERLLEIKGISKKKLKSVSESIAEHRDIEALMVFLKGLGISDVFATAIYRKYGNDGISVIRRDPYVLADEMIGVGFKRADAVATASGTAPDSPSRLRAGTLHALRTATDKLGHTFLSVRELVDTASSPDVLGVDPQLVEDILPFLAEGKDAPLVLDGDRAYLPVWYHSERGTARLLRAKLSEGTALRTDGGEEADIDAISAKTGMTYNDRQREAIASAITKTVSVITGGPGTGKTTIIKAVIEHLKSRGETFHLCAPTGRAAKRMTDATGERASTIHRLLEWNREGFAVNADNPLPGDCLIVDECSMVDVALMYSLLKAVPTGMRVVLVGDADQLPSVGSGKAFSDIIDSGTVPVVKLEVPQRQAMGSDIIANAHRINRGEMPDLNGTRDFRFIPTRNPEETRRTVTELYAAMESETGYKPSDTVLLTAMRKREAVLGCTEFNDILQGILNPLGRPLKRTNTELREGDPVMQLKNNYAKDVFNGDTGRVTRVSQKERTLTAEFDGRSVEFEKQELDNLDLAYATTVHKSQGSEYPVVIVIASTAHYRMLRRNLLYTAVTRASKLCFVVGQAQAVAMMVKNDETEKRYTYLKERLNGTA